MTQSPLYVSLEFTPNPNTLKYVVNRTLLAKGAVQFSDLESAQKSSPLATELMGLAGVASVMLGRDFITVTKSDAGDWDKVHAGASKVLEDFLNRGEPVLIGDQAESGQHKSGLLLEIEQKIVDILDAEIRPAVAKDGGDITFERFEEGVVYLDLKGACSGCPSSKMTLKMGVETRLKKAIPEVREVVAV